MSSQLPKYPKYRLAKRAENEETTAAHNTATAEAEAPSKRPLELRKASPHIKSEDSMQSTSDMLEDAYGAETRTRQRSQLIALINHIFISLLVIALFIAGTLAYAHVYKGWPRLEPTNWYIPFMLSAALSAWLCLKSAKLWDDRDRSLALVGVLLAGVVAYSNAYVLEYAASGDRIKPSNGLWAPADVNDLYITAEFNALRGVGHSKAAYTSLPSKAYYKAFNAITRDQWRPHFERFLSPEEMSQLNSINIHDNMYLVVERIREKRVTIWEELEEQQLQPDFEFRVRQILLTPYTRLLSYL
ncbi:hypothetical protein ACWPKO_00590 [Coraliomargarita sp. W4R53]